MREDPTFELDDPKKLLSEHATSTPHKTPPRSLRTSISPPPSRIRRSKPSLASDYSKQKPYSLQHGDAQSPDLAAIEAGHAQIQNHLKYFSNRLTQHTRPNAPLSMPAFQRLYRRNQQPHGRHFVIHQHDHPVAGVHYDLRLQINETSSISWAIMYGLPGNANSWRLNRNATETRVHNVWNHLIETASATTGSLLIWDTGEYEILPYREDIQKETDEELSDDCKESECASTNLSDCEKLHHAFQNRKIRIRLHGTRLPKYYTLSIRLLTSENRHEQPAKPSRKRRRKPSAAIETTQITPPTSDLEEDEEVPDAHPVSMDASTSALEREIAEQEDEEVRRTNAYPGATNDIGSIHQRRWYLSMDRYSSGFRPLPIRKGSKGGRREWVRRRDGDELLGFEPFFVRGREVERSVLTGRSADEVMADEGVEGFVARKGWRAVTE